MYATSRNGPYSRQDKSQRRGRRWRRRPPVNPEIILPQGIDGDNPPVIPREEDESAEDYAYRLMQAVTSEQVRSFQEMVRAMREISESAKRHRSDESEDTDESNYQDATDRIKIKRIRKRVQSPIFKGIVGET